MKGKRLKRTEWTFSKKMIACVLILSEIQIFLSYLLAFLGRETIAETLSIQIVITVLGVIIPYFVKSTIENISKYTNLFGGANSEVMNDSPDKEDFS